MSLFVVVLHRHLGPQDIPQLPQELCGIWAYIKWELAGCPERSQSDADAEYQQAIEVRRVVWSCHGWSGIFSNACVCACQCIMCVPVHTHTHTRMCMHVLHHRRHSTRRDMLPTPDHGAVNPQPTRGHMTLVLLCTHRGIAVAQTTPRRSSRGCCRWASRSTRSGGSPEVRAPATRTGSRAALQTPPPPPPSNHPPPPPPSRRLHPHKHPHKHRPKHHLRLLLRWTFRKTWWGSWRTFCGKKRASPTAPILVTRRAHN